MIKLPATIVGEKHHVVKLSDSLIRRRQRLRLSIFKQHLTYTERLQSIRPPHRLFISTVEYEPSLSVHQSCWDL
jgi:hypothetical protein